MSTRAKRPSGNPARKQDLELEMVQRAMRLAVEAVGKLENSGRLTDAQMGYLRASAGGLMFTVSALTELPSPVEVIHGREPMTKEFEEAFTV